MCRPPMGEGGTLIFFLCVGLEPASTVYPQKYQEYQSYPKLYLKFSNPKKSSNYVA